MSVHPPQLLGLKHAIENINQRTERLEFLMSSICDQMIEMNRILSEDFELVSDGDEAASEYTIGDSDECGTDADDHSEEEERSEDEEPTEEDKAFIDDSGVEGSDESSDRSWHPSDDETESEEEEEEEESESEPMEH